MRSLFYHLFVVNLLSNLVASFSNNIRQQNSNKKSNILSKQLLVVLTERDHNRRLQEQGLRIKLPTDMQKSESIEWICKQKPKQQKDCYITQKGVYTCKQNYIAKVNLECECKEGTSCSAQDKRVCQCEVSDQNEPFQNEEQLQCKCQINGSTRTYVLLTIFTILFVLIFLLVLLFVLIFRICYEQYYRYSVKRNFETSFKINNQSSWQTQRQQLQNKIKDRINQEDRELERRGRLYEQMNIYSSSNLV